MQSWLAVSIYKRSCRACGTENAHLVASVRVKETITHEEVVVVTYVPDIRTFARRVFAACYLLAEVCIIASIGTCACSAVFYGIVPQTCVLVQF